MGTGSEIELCLRIVDEYKNYNISVISFFSWELFELQTEEYKKSILIKNIPKISIEALTSFGWSKYSDFQIGLDRFGWSGKCTEVFEEAGFTPKKVMEKIESYLKNKN